MYILEIIIKVKVGKIMSHNKMIDVDIFNTLELIYKPNNLIISNIFKEQESQEYNAYTYTLNSKNNAMKILFRAAKITPKKVGQFVTLWKREGGGPIQPYDLTDDVDLFVINIYNNKHSGQFVFPKNILCEKGIVSQNQKGGKRAMRVYAPWDITESRQAKTTQAWQIKYFLDIPHSDYTAVDPVRVKKLYHI